MTGSIEETVRVQEDTETGTIAQEMKIIVEKEGGGDQVTGALAHGVDAVEEVEAVMTEEVVGPIGTTAQEGRVAAEEEGENLGTEAQAQEVRVTVEEEVLITTEAVGPAMERNENSAQRPKVMGGLL